MKILVADDSPVIRSVVTRLLAEQGHDVVEACDGVETIQEFYAQRPDLVVLDLQMPRMTGYMACRMLKEDWSTSHVPVLILTAHDSAEDRYWAEKSGADGYVTKETLAEGLVPAIKAATVSRVFSDLTGTAPEPAGLEEMDVLARLTAMLDRSLFESTIANEIMTLSGQAHDLDGTAEEILFIVRRFVGYDLAAISVASESEVFVRIDRPVDDLSLKVFTERAIVDLSERVSGGVNPQKIGVVVREAESSLPVISVGDAWPSVFSTTLRLRGEVIGALTLASSTANAFGPQVARNLRTVESAVATMIDSAVHHRRRMREAARQSLSSLYGFGEEAS